MLLLLHSPERPQMVHEVAERMVEARDPMLDLLQLEASRTLRSVPRRLGLRRPRQGRRLEKLLALCVSGLLFRAPLRLVLCEPREPHGRTLVASDGKLAEYRVLRRGRLERDLLLPGCPPVLFDREVLLAEPLVFRLRAVALLAEASERRVILGEQTFRAQRPGETCGRLVDLRLMPLEQSHHRVALLSGKLCEL